jgi:hypothetical protein
MKAWKFRLGIVGVFALGVVVGAVGTGLTIHNRADGFGYSKPEQAITRILSRLKRELNLSDEQEKEVAPIVREAFAKMRMLRNRLTPEVEALIAESAQRIKPHLNAEQQRLLDIHNAEVLRRWRQFASPVEPPPVGGSPAEPPPRQ